MPADLGHCQCGWLVQHVCEAVPTAEDLLCDPCREGCRYSVRWGDGPWHHGNRKASFSA